MSSHGVRKLPEWWAHESPDGVGLGNFCLLRRDSEQRLPRRDVSSNESAIITKQQQFFTSGIAREVAPRR
jgi:hypothetical protein